MDSFLGIVLTVLMAIAITYALTINGIAIPLANITISIPVLILPFCRR